jgi:hypothetical protein
MIESGRFRFEDRWVNWQNRAELPRWYRKVRVSVVDRDVAALDEADTAKALAELGFAWRGISHARSATQIAHHRQCRLLGPRRERPRRSRAAEKRDEVASSQCCPQNVTPGQIRAETYHIAAGGV